MRNGGLNLEIEYFPYHPPPLPISTDRLYGITSAVRGGESIGHASGYRYRDGKWEEPSNRGWRTMNPDKLDEKISKSTFTVILRKNPSDDSA